MLPHLLGWARILCACFSLWVVPFTVYGQNARRPMAATLQVATLTSLQTFPEQPSPQSAAAFFQEVQSASDHFSGLGNSLAWSWARMLVAAVAMIGAVLLSFPLAFLYLRTKPPHEFDSSVLFSIVFLAATIAGIMVVVQGSIARALSLAGVVSAVRFRSSLRDSNDAVYLLGAIGVGFAAGSSLLDVGVVISALLSLTLFLLWKVRLDALKQSVLPKDHESHHGHYHRDSVPLAAQEQVAVPLVIGKSTPPAADGNGAVPPSIFEVRPQALAKLGYIVLETTHPERTRILVEAFLERETKTWRLDGSTGNGVRHKHASGVATLMYLVRFRKHSQPEAIVERLKALGQSSHFSVRLETGEEVVERIV